MSMTHRTRALTRTKHSQIERLDGSAAQHQFAVELIQFQKLLLFIGTADGDANRWQAKR